MSEDKKFAWLLQQYNTFETDVRSLTDEIVDRSSSTSTSTPVYLTVEPSEARGHVPNFSTLLTPRSKLSTSSTDNISNVSSPTNNNSAIRRDGQSLFDNYFEFSKSIQKTRRVLLRSAATDKELRMADVHLWRRNTRSVTIETTSSSASAITIQTSSVESLHISKPSAPSSTPNTLKLKSTTNSIISASSLTAASLTSSTSAAAIAAGEPMSTLSAAESSASPSASSPSCCSSDSESSSSSASYASDSDEEASSSTVPHSWPSTSPMMCALETSQCAIAADLELPPQNCCV